MPSTVPIRGPRDARSARSRRALAPCAQVHAHTHGGAIKGKRVRQACLLCSTRRTEQGQHYRYRYHFPAATTQAHSLRTPRVGPVPSRVLQGSPVSKLIYLLRGWDRDSQARGQSDVGRTRAQAAALPGLASRRAHASCDTSTPALAADDGVSTVCQQANAKQALSLVRRHVRIVPHGHAHMNRPSSLLRSMAPRR